MPQSTGYQQEQKPKKKSPDRNKAVITKRENWNGRYKRVSRLNGRFYSITDWKSPSRKSATYKKIDAHPRDKAVIESQFLYKKSGTRKVITKKPIYGKIGQLTLDVEIEGYGTFSGYSYIDDPFRNYKKMKADCIMSAYAYATEEDYSGQNDMLDDIDYMIVPGTERYIYVVPKGEKL